MRYKHLTLGQRYEIKAYLHCGKTQKFIAEQLGVSESTISFVSFDGTKLQTYLKYTNKFEIK